MSKARWVGDSSSLTPSENEDRTPSAAIPSTSQPSHPLPLQPSGTTSGFILPGSFDDHKSTRPSTPPSTSQPQHDHSSSLDRATLAPSLLEARTPEPAIGSSPSSSPVRSPFTTPQCSQPSQSSPQQSSSSAQMAFVSPWHALAAMSGAPTPTLEYPPTLGPRDSPKLGQPFERLNLGPSCPAPSNSFSFGGGESSSSPFESSPLRQNRLASVDSSTMSRTPTWTGGIVPSGAISGPTRRADSPLRGPLAVAGVTQRRSSMPMPSLSLGVTGGSSTVTTSSSPLTGNTSSTYVKPIDASELAGIATLPATLILDLRPPSSFEMSHLTGAHSLSVPSTLLRRPAFGLPKLIQMLSPESRPLVEQWKSMCDIVLVDSDSSSAPEGSILHGVAHKFAREGYTGHLSFLYGGFKAIDGDDRFQRESGTAKQGSSPSAESPVITAPTLGRLSRLAFQHGSTTAYTGVPQTAGVAIHDTPSKLKSLTLPATAAAPFPSGNPGNARERLQPANPFFDNIRQNLELSHGGITERISLGLPKGVVDRAGELPSFLRELVTMPNDKSMEVLALQFQCLERREQERLQSVMDVLSRANGSPSEGRVHNSTDDAETLIAGASTTHDGYYPFSITAGVERGTKNRYKNIWPYDFSRVRLGSLADDESDYINASFVQPRGTTRRYIATQGPLDATYRDFWTVVWEQNVHVIVMLTKQYEGGLLKCGQYWKKQQFGNLHLQVLSETGGDDEADAATTGFDFGAAARLSSPADSSKIPNIKRTFRLSHAQFPDKSRLVVQIQCVSWPDFDVPDSPEVLLDLMHDVDEAVQQTCGCIGDRCDIPPVLVHCSAGIGRTGSFILADAITDGLRRERRAPAECGSPGITQKADMSTPELPNIVSTTIRRESPESMIPVASEDESKDPENKDSESKDPDSMDLDSPGAVDNPGLKSLSSHQQGPLSVTPSNTTHRLPTPLSSMANPIVDVLSAMRVQRMSLVQSLRQYVFVHRAIIAHFLRTLDKDRADLQTQPKTEGSEDTLVSNASGMSSSTKAPSVSSGTDESGHVKRKPSSTDLQPETDLRLRMNVVDNLQLGDKTTNLAKRASFKKRRG